MAFIKYTPKAIEQKINVNQLFKVSSSPVIPFAEEIVEQTTLGDGTISYRHTGIYRDLDIVLDCNFVAESREAWIEHISLLQKHFKSTGILEFLEDDPNHFWKVKKVSLDLSNRVFKIASEFKLHFVVDPYRYLKSYTKPYELISDKTIEIHNPFSKSCPTFRIYNTSTLANVIDIEVNQKLFQIKQPFHSAVQDKIVEYIEINTENAYLKQIFTDGTHEFNTISTIGSFDWIRFLPGTNTIHISSDIGLVSVEIMRNFREL